MVSLTVPCPAVQRQDLDDAHSSVYHATVARFKSRSQFLWLIFSSILYTQETENIAREGSHLLMKNIYFIAKK